MAQSKRIRGFRRKFEKLLAMGITQNEFSIVHLEEVKTERYKYVISRIKKQHADNQATK